MKKVKKIISLLLIITLITTLIPSKAYAAEDTNTVVNNEENNETSSTNEETIVPEIIGEVTGMREANVKHFLKDDYSYEAVVYQDPVHYLEDGDWKEVDNSLTVASDASVVSEEGVAKVQTATSNNIVKNKANDYEVSFAKNANVNKLVGIEKDGYELTWNVVQAENIESSVVATDEEEIHNTVVAEAENIINANEQLSELTSEEKQDAKDTIIDNEMIKIVENASSELIYTGILPGVDLKYKVSSGELKEDIILNEYSKDFQITFHMNTKGLAARLEKDRTISFYDEKDASKVVFSTAEPFMYDQVGASSEEVTVNLEEVEDGYNLTLTPSDTWLAESERSYPVVIDPVVNAASSSDTIWDTFACSVDTEQKNNSTLLYVGKYSAEVGTTRTFIQFQLPDIGLSSMVTGAKMSLFSKYVGSGGAQVNAYKLTEAWDRTNMHWSNLPDKDSNILDYNTIGVTEKQFDFDITSVAKDWYTNGNNYGIMLKAKNETSGYAAFASSDNGANASGKPMLSITYVSSVGLEGYWTNHSQDVLRAGTAYVNDYNGNLVLIHNDLSMSGNRMPLTVNHVYNSGDRQSQVGYGSGWRINLSQYVGKTGLTGSADYYYIDEDGTKHYFVMKEGKYQDESGLGLILTVNSDNTYTLIDTIGNLLKFNALGYLISIADDKNSIKLTYNSSNRLICVMDGADRETIFTVASDGNLSSITDPAGRKTKYEYTGTQLSKITYPDGKVSIYMYDSENKLTKVKNYNGYNVTYTYTTGNEKRVRTATEYDVNGKAGNALTMQYGNNSTVFTFGKSNKETYQFNDMGNTVSIQDNVANAQYYEYGSGENVNALISQSKLQKTTLNYIKNHNIERETNFTVGTNGGTGGNSYSSDSYLGAKSLMVTKTDNVNAQFYYQKYNLIKGNTYTFSAYVKTKDISDTNHKGAYISAFYYKDADKTETFTTRSKYLAGNSGWTRLETTITLPTDVPLDIITVRVGLQSETGTAYFDNLQLEEGSIANRYNLVENGDFSDSSLDFWKTSGTDSLVDSVVNIPTGAPKMLDNNYKIMGDSQKNKKIYQSINTSGKAGDDYVFSAWAKANSTPINSTRDFSLLLEFANKDGSKTPIRLPFNQDSMDWQYVSGAAEADKDYSSINIYGVYSLEENAVYFDAFRLYKEEFGQDFVETTPTPAITPTPIPDPNEYDDYGNIIDYNTPGDDIFTHTSTSYTTDSNYVDSITDEDGNSVDYNYDINKGILNSVTDGNGTTTNYAYDNMDRLQSVFKDVDGQTVSNSYSYDNDQLNSITHNGFSYNFDYDTFGNNTAVSVGSQKLIENTFEEKTYNLLQSTYGNGQFINYAYDSLGRLLEKKSQSNTTFTYQYDSEGNLAFLEDKINSVNYRYYFDLNGRLMKATDSLGNSSEYTFDETGSLSMMSQNINGIDHVTKFQQNEEGSMQSVLYNSDQSSVQSRYDSLGRLDSKIISTGSSTQSTEYTYQNGVAKNPDLGDSTTNKVSSINNNGTTISYTYDRNSNIKTITEDKDRLLAYYSFDHNDMTDDSGNGNDGTTKGGVNYVPGKYGFAAEFDGIDDYADLTDFDTPETFSISMWVNPYSTNDGQAFLGKHTKDGGNIFLLGNWSGSSQLRIRSVTNTQATKVAGYQHIVAVVKKISDTQSKVKYYRNNILLWENTMNDIMGITKGKPWTLGQEWDGNAESDYFKGIIDELAFYSGDLTQTEVSDLYTSGVKVDRNDTQTRYQYNELNELKKEETKVNDGLIAYYSFDESSAKDDSSNGNDGTLQGAPKFIEGKKGNAVELDGNDDYVELKDFDVPENFSISMWVNPYTTTDDQAFIGKNTSSGGNMMLAGFWNNSNQISIRGAAQISDTKTTGYQHWVINVSKVSATESRIRFFKDNTLVKDSLVTGTLDNVKGRPWTIGQEWDGDTASSFAKGAVDEVAFYDHILTRNEVDKIYTNGITVNKGSTVENTYDAGGNIRTKTETTYNSETGEATSDTVNYEYGDTNWKDKLTAYDGKAITYDAIGNPLTYDGNTYTWQNGRELASINGDGITTSYKYNDEGIRTQKTVNGVVTDYFLEGNKVTYEESYQVSDPNTKYDKIYYTYDSEGALVSMNLDGVEYYYTRNVQDDIIGLFDKDGSKVAGYIYDSWGELVSIKDQNGNDIINDKTNVGYKNPYRYRGYRYDSEIGMYYLQSRYYNPKMQSFLNADEPIILMLTQGEVLGASLFVYSINNPVNNSDPNGYWSNGWWNSVTFVGRAIDVAIICFTAGQAISGWYALKKFLKSNQRKIVKNIAPKILKMFGSVVANALGAVIDVALTIFGTSIGDMIAKALDYADKWWGKKKNNGYIYG